jgi:3-oxoacyl-[acyl-carrier protein] reductase
MKTALVLGGSGDIGTAIADDLAQRGYLVTCVGSADMDLANKKSIDQYMSGRTYDVLVHSAGLNVIGALEDRDLTDIELAIDTNLIGFLDIVKRLIPYWKQQQQGRIVVISSLYGFLARHGRLPYVISKHGLVGAVKALAIELAKYGILTNAVSPGYIDTKMTSKNNTPETIARLVQGIPQARMGTPKDIARVVGFLVHDNTYINGQDIIVDGGFSIGGFQ